MARHRVDSASMQKLLTELADITAYADSLIAQVEAIRSTVSTEWSGAANAQYQELHAEWTAAAQQMTSGAAHITQKATAASTNYDMAADSSTSLWG